MPTNLLQADVGFPQFKEEQKPDEKITQVVNYLYMLLEQLRYSFGNLGSENFSESGIEELQTILTEPIYGRLENDEGLINELSINATGLYNRLYDQTTGDITQLALTAQGLYADMHGEDGVVATIAATANGLYSEVWGSTPGETSRITQNANAITQKVSSGDVSTMISQFANGLVLSASNGQTSSTLSLYSGGVLVDSANIEITGMVKFSDLSQTGKSTSIRGDYINTGTITAQNVGVTGAFTVSNGETNGGYMGYINTPAGNYGMGVKHRTNSGGAVYVTNMGSKMTSGSSEQGQIYVYNTTISAQVTSVSTSRVIYFDAANAYFGPGTAAADLVLDLGRSAAPWNNIYITGNIYRNGSAIL